MGSVPRETNSSSSFGAVLERINVSQVGKLFFEFSDDERFPNQPHIARIFIAEIGIRSCDNDEFQRA